ncbi:MAG TPA: hypothetical protein VLL54_02295 [Pyrinomonadaceae bacterium]|nr:hypothetical protein [Pyrinomonadaceae bacterium]
MLKKITQWTTAVLLIVMAGLLGFAAYLGAFQSITVAEAEEGPFHFVYRELSGNDMGKLGEITTALNNEIRSAGITEMKPFDVFQPPGIGVPNEVGFIISEADVVRLRPAERSIKSRIISRQKYMTTTFPFKNRLSFVVGYMKIDPVLAKYRADHGYASAPGITRNNGETITYLQPIQLAK